MDNSEIQIWDLKDGMKIHSFKGHKKPATSICFIPNTTFMASAAADSSVKIWCLKTKKLVKSLKDHSENVNFIKALELKNNYNQYLCSGGEDGKVCFYACNKKTKRFMKTTIFKNNGKLFCCDGNENYVAVGGSSKSIFVYEINDKGTVKERKLKRIHRKQLNFLTFSFQNDMFVTGSEDGAVIVWKNNGENWEYTEVKILEQVEKKNTNKFRPNAAVWNFDDTSLCILGNDGKIRIWNSDGTEYIKTFDGKHHKNSYFIQARPSSVNHIFSIGFEGTLKIWNMTSSECIEISLNLKKKSNGFDASLSADGQKLVVGGKKFMKIFTGI
uniref:Anaphase-promoting complex subunit 4-like WD40 domain-containing protein n=1 Tax=Panagrolaimus superbus TaxID=310955 RepID=A0A914Y5X4_9BILA